jgi:hypothetical protein
MSKLRKSAKGEECTLMIFPYCNGNPETTVLCHLPSGDKGWALKTPDFFAVYGCSDCHSILDRAKRVEDVDELELHKIMLRSLYRTQKRMIEKGLISID